MPRRNPNRRRKSSRKTRAESNNDLSLGQVASHQRGQYSNRMYADRDVIAAARFSEESIQRQLECAMPLPPSRAYQTTCYGPHGNGYGEVIPWWQVGCWYTYTHPVTFEDVVVWFDGVHCNEEEYFGGKKEPVYSHDMQKLSSPPLVTYREGYHDPILKDQADDWWRLFGHDVPAQFILASNGDLEPEIGSCRGRGQEERSVMGQYSPQHMRSEPTTKEGKEWDAAAYFAPYRTPETESCSGFANTGCNRKSIIEDESAESEGCGNRISTAEAVDRIERSCRGRDDWECDFCGLECFCWTVKADATEVW